LLDQLSLDEPSRNKVITLPEANQNAPENRPGGAPKGDSSSKQPFSGAKMVVAGREMILEKKHLGNGSGVKCG